MFVFTSLLAGLVFGLGLILSGMANPAKVLGFLDLGGAWDPSLALVMGGAIVVGFFAFLVAQNRTRSLLGAEMRLPGARHIDRRLMLGSTVFGIGWGIAGFCPGPGLVALGMGEARAGAFVGAMLVGMVLFELLEKLRTPPRPNPHERHPVTPTLTVWLVTIATVSILLAYELALLLVQMRSPQRLARSAHASLREEWFAALSQQAGSEILAVQTLRNALMSATMTASTAALALIGAVTLSAPSLGAGEATLAHFSPRLALELMLMTMLFASLVCSAMAVRYYNHAGFICAMPVGSAERENWAPTAAVYLRRAGLLYSWGLRHLMMVAPILAAIVYPFAGPVAAVLVVLALAGFDRFPG